MYWTKGNTNVFIFFAVAVLLLHIIAFPNYIMPLPILLTGTGTIFFFVVGLQYYSNAWQKRDSFIQRIFLHSLLYRFAAIQILYLLTYFYDPANLPMEIHAQDSWNYHYSGTMVADALDEGRPISMALAQIWKSETDYGFATIIGFIYYLFGKNILLIKLFNALLASVTVVRIYQISRFLYDEKRARLAGIIAMLMPSLLWFTGFYLKETTLIFLIVNIAYLTHKIITSKEYRVLNALVILIHFGVIFYFRVILAPIIMTCVILQILLHKTSSRNYKISAISVSMLFVIGSFLVMKELGMDKHIETAIEASQDQFGNELSDTSKKRGVTYAAAIISPLLIAAAIITPFPSLLNFEAAQIGIYSHFQNEIIRNCLYFFVFLGLFNVYKTRNKSAIFVGSFALIYIMVLAVSGISFQDRFQILALPFLIIFMADGIATKYPKRNKHWIQYLSVIFMTILFWNLFKLSNRGLI
ncbi:glycosyltransferase family 39 protein [Aquimarina sp. 2201CG5-10]|uniref:glycosyltransferase family 39 protein n=1 Tax=Aquimarina callyspongiae TaxID=3098150 RepID=UPI002AB5435C|nr:glycosyltransferase family 39 protein [Aquimarina sp. 2201CG5-10]MDY8136893.1 glycosyltransferase family 39 protein [Aquimarina sp. 2201CG5-10]